MSINCIGYYSPLGVGGFIPTPLAPGVAPSNVVAPLLYGMADPEEIQPDETVYVTSGIWEGSPVIAYTYQWYSGDTALAGETGSSYTLDLGAPGAGGAVSCRVTATNATGSAYVQTPAIAVLDTDAMDWILAEEGAGVVFTSPQKEAVSTFYSEQKASGVWAMMRFLYPTWTGIAAADAIDMVEQRTATFPAGMGHEVGYIVSDGLSQYMDTGYDLTTNPIGALATMGALCIVPVTVDVPNKGFIMHANDNPTTKSITLEHALVAGPIFTRTGNVSAVDGGLSAANQTGFLVGSQIGSGADTQLVARRQTAGYSLLNDISGSAITMTASRNIVCMAQYANNSDLIVKYNTVGRYGCFFFAEGLNSAQISSLTLGLKTLYETLTGLTIP